MRLLILLVSFFMISCSPKTQNNSSKIITVAEGKTFRSVLNKLENEKIIKNIFVLRVLGRITGKDSQLKSGTYLISPNISYMRLLDIISSGRGIGTLITIPEGFNAFQIASLLEENEIVSAKDFLTEISKTFWLTNYNIPTNGNFQINDVIYLEDKNGQKYIVPSNPPQHSLEGYLFPDSYSFEKNMSASNIIQSMLRRFDEVIASLEIRNQVLKQKKSLHELLTFASIVQKEAAHNDEMPRVAGVYHNRLERNMILQADPTLIYALILDGQYDGQIRTQHLRPPYPSAYNTYYTNTLPPSPIASVGKDAILASLNPESHNYLYFVAQPDGTHQFSRTLREHNEAVRRWVDYRRGN